MRSFSADSAACDGVQELEDLIAAVETAVGGRPEIRDIGLLQSAVERPRSTAFGDKAYPDLDAKAAALLHSIVAGHPLVDGNERLGWVAVRLFYRMNDTDVHPEPDEAYQLDGGSRDRDEAVDTGGNIGVRPVPGRSWLREPGVAARRRRP